MTVNKKIIVSTIFGLFVAILFVLPVSVDAHRSGCHRWHSCPSDSGSYICGDAGYACRYSTYSEGSTPSYSSPTYSYSVPSVYLPSPGFVRITATTTVYALGTSGRPMRSWQDLVSFARKAYGYSSDINGNPIVKEIDPNEAWGYGISPHFQPPIKSYRIFQVPGDSAVWELSNWHGTWGSRAVFQTSSSFIDQYGGTSWAHIKPITQLELQKYYYMAVYR